MHAPSSEHPADLDAVQAGQHHVEQDHVVGVGERGREGLLAVVDHVRRKARILQAPANAGRQPVVVLHDQDSQAQPPSNRLTC